MAGSFELPLGLIKRLQHFCIAQAAAVAAATGQSLVLHTLERRQREWDREREPGGIRSCHGIQITSTCTRVIRARIP